MTVYDLPAVNASLNTVATILLASGYIAIKKDKKELHKALMISALVVSAIFLGCYLVYHAHVGSKPFPDLGIIKTIYLIILVPHIILAAVMVPMILKTFWHAFRSEWEPHKKIARWTFPIWMYVSVTGVIIYLMLYVWYAPKIEG
jgi:putative membrane protein